MMVPERPCKSTYSPVEVNEGKEENSKEDQREEQGPPKTADRKDPRPAVSFSTPRSGSGPLLLGLSPAGGDGDGDEDEGEGLIETTPTHVIYRTTSRRSKMNPYFDVLMCALLIFAVTNVVFTSWTSSLAAAKARANGTAPAVKWDGKNLAVGHTAFWLFLILSCLHTAFFWSVFTFSPQKVFLAIEGFWGVSAIAFLLWLVHKGLWLSAFFFFGAALVVTSFILSKRKETAALSEILHLVAAVQQKSSSVTPLAFFLLFIHFVWIFMGVRTLHRLHIMQTWHAFATNLGLLFCLFWISRVLFFLEFVCFSFLVFSWYGLDSAHLPPANRIALWQNFDIDTLGLAAIRRVCCKMPGTFAAAALLVSLASPVKDLRLLRCASDVCPMFPFAGVFSPQGMLRLLLHQEGLWSSFRKMYRESLQSGSVALFERETLSAFVVIGNVSSLLWVVIVSHSVLAFSEAFLLLCCVALFLHLSVCSAPFYSVELSLLFCFHSCPDGLKNLNSLLFHRLSRMMRENAWPRDVENGAVIPRGALGPSSVSGSGGRNAMIGRAPGGLELMERRTKGDSARSFRTEESQGSGSRAVTIVGDSVPLPSSLGRPAGDPLFVEEVKGSATAAGGSGGSKTTQVNLGSKESERPQVHGVTVGTPGTGGLFPSSDETVAVAGRARLVSGEVLGGVGTGRGGPSGDPLGTGTGTVADSGSFG
uniref:Uncharacterized protein n=1 Tax=Chromera velia CCMP2878 TaxID=1169474 RepID=A0A0G4FIG6_9ALVE|eukprot:Cvel_17189.t1-p1 / transcript=Cvel_17189.t1 / gene=Cvel_17189 / organism=Chromera_velia_CCMP2878 / gene_product=hypothetical protein / transcript_product=hypothetical protein / location=Cvel_scaffold1358:10478-15666(-) / protein_length=703 / sequence_SO=supercontig / SO=protein_coding / is_pseudo=false